MGNEVFERRSILQLICGVYSWVHDDGGRHFQT